MQNVVLICSLVEVVFCFCGCFCKLVMAGGRGGLSASVVLAALDLVGMCSSL